MIQGRSIAYCEPTDLRELIMTILLVTSSTQLPLTEACPVAVDCQDGSVGPFDPGTEWRGKRLVMYRTDARNVVAIRTAGSGSLTINGNRVTGGLYNIDGTAVCRMREDGQMLAFGIVFEDTASDVPAGTRCDGCGLRIDEPGKRHCAKNHCQRCIEAFGGKCMTCGKELRDTAQSEKTSRLIRDYFPET